MRQNEIAWVVLGRGLAGAIALHRSSGNWLESSPSHLPMISPQPKDSRSNAPRVVPRGAGRNRKRAPWKAHHPYLEGGALR